MSLSYPVQGTVTQQFGSNPSSIQPNGHTGMDFGIPVGTPIYAADSGNIAFEGWATTLSASNPWWIAPAYAGIVVVINHNDGFMTLYGHMSSTVINNGQFVEKGQLIGYSGNTGLSTGPHLHFEVLGWPLQPYNGYYGRLNPNGLVSGYAKAAPLAPNQRKVGANNLNQRAEPNTTSAIVRVIQANTVETFDGYVVGEMFSGHDVWYKDGQGYVWSGAFEDSSTNGLNNLTPPPPAPVLAPNQRKVSSDAINQRAEPRTGSPVVRIIAPNTTETFDGFVRGESVTLNGYTSDIWYKDSLGYAWSGPFRPSDTSGLPDLTPTPAPQPTPNKEVTVYSTGVRLRTLPFLDSTVKEVLPGGSKHVPAAYVEADTAFDTNIWLVLSGGFAHISGFVDASIEGLPKIETPMKTDDNPGELGYAFAPDFDFVEYRPAHYDNMGDLDFPANPAMIVLHQFDAKDKFPTIGGVINWFQTSRPAAPSSAHFVVSGDRIVQMVSLKDRAFHAGSVGNNYIGIEVDPQEDEKTVASVKKLISALNTRYGKVFPYIKHQNVPGNSTSCGNDIHLEKYVVDTVTPPVVVEPPVIVVPPVVEEPQPVPTPEPVPEPDPVVDEEYEALVDDLLVSLKKVLIHLNK